MKQRLVLLLFSVIIFIGISTAKEEPPLKPPKHGGIYVVAHRGAHNGIPENSLPAYKKDIELDVDFIEVDIRMTKDGKFVSIHNSTIDAYVEDMTGNIKDFTLSELRVLDIGSRIGPEWKGTKIPTIDKILDLCKGKCGIYLDLKDAPVAPLIEKIKARNMERDVLWCETEFDVLEQIQELCSECILMPDPNNDENVHIMLNRFKPYVVAPVWNDFSKNLVDKCHAAGAIVIVDEHDRHSWQQALEWGADGIQTDYPEELIEFLKNRFR